MPVLAADSKSAVSASRILIVDDVRIFRESLTAQLAPHYRYIRCAWDAPSLLREIGDGMPNLILLNSMSPDSARILQATEDLAPRSKVIVFGLSQQDESEVIACAEAGAAGLHLRSQSFDQLLELIREVEVGKASCAPEVSALLLKRIRGDVARRADPANGELTKRESEILTLLQGGLTNKQIACELYISVNTVKNHVHNLLAKLGAKSRHEASRTYSPALRPAS